MVKRETWKERERERERRKTPIALSVSSWKGEEEGKRGWSRLISKRNERKSGRQTTASRKKLGNLNEPVSRLLFFSIPLSRSLLIPFLRVSFRFNTGDYRSRAPTSPFLSEEQNRWGGDD